MDELVKMVSQKVGISESQARTAVETVVNFLKERLPAPVEKQVDAILANPSASAADIAKDIGGGLFGKK